MQPVSLHHALVVLFVGQGGAVLVVAPSQALLLLHQKSAVQLDQFGQCGAQEDFVSALIYSLIMVDKL